ncbi:MAG: bifunctional glutamate N-acetyltransferase/amino-acid acetyltransferase ArgJ [Pseudomonadota bacterium]
MKIAGFKAAAVAAGLRYKDRLDLGLIVADEAAAAAGVFTRNLVQAAPVIWSRDKIASGRARAILVNAGRANACTGAQGLADAAASAAAAAAALGCPPDQVLLASTGVIGQPLNIEKLAAAIPALVAGLAEDNLPQVARAIMTTDTVIKMAEASGTIGERTISAAGMAKGSGMIQPDMATMLSFVLTDAAVSPACLQGLLREGAEMTFNRVTVDGDTSTNDTLYLLASGRAGNEPIAGPESPGYQELKRVVLEVLAALAGKIAADGEGATKLVKIVVRGAKDDGQAKTAALTVANSPLVKTAIFGQDANWGRILMALGRSGAQFDPLAVNVSLNDAPLVRNGVDAGGEAKAAAVMKEKEFTINIEIGAGPGSAEVLTCDLSLDYVKINADYRS